MDCRSTARTFMAGLKTLRLAPILLAWYTPIPSFTGSRTGRKPCSCKSGIPSPWPRFPVPSNKSSAKPSSYRRSLAPPFQAHRFWLPRRFSSKESAAIGGAAHLINFLGTDTIAAIQLLNEFYSADLSTRVSAQLRRLCDTRVRAFHHHRLGRSQRRPGLRQHAGELPGRHRRLRQRFL